MPKPPDIPSDMTDQEWIEQCRSAGLPVSTELEVIALVADGVERAEIAKRLGIGWSTVQTRLTRAKKRVGVQTTSHLVAMAIREKWIP